MWTANTVTMPWDILDRMERAVARVRDRLLRATAALNATGLPYAVVGGHAVASWVATVDEGAVRNSRDVDILVRRQDLPALTAGLGRSGFIPAEVMNITRFLDGPNAKPSESIHLLFAGERLRPEHPVDLPDITTIDDPVGYRVITLDALLRMKLISNRNKDRMHLRDLIDVGLVDQSWVSRLPAVLGERLQTILDTPES